MEFVLSNEQMREADEYTIENLGLKGEILMESAGKACAEKIASCVPCKFKHRALIICGKGNNGGDGYVIARYLKSFSFDVVVQSLADEASLKGDAAFHFRVAKKFGVDIQFISNADQLLDDENDIIVDAMLGTGSKGAARGVFADIIQRLENTEKIVFSVDIPSGLNGNSSAVAGSAIKADYTLAIHVKKIAHVIYPAREYCGKVSVLPIGISSQTYADAAYRLFKGKDISIDLPAKHSHKYSRGELLIIGGDPRMAGAVHWAVRGALHSGAGYVTTAVPQSSHEIIKNLSPEAVSLPLPEINRNIDIPAAVDLIKDNLSKTRCILLGSGFGRNQNRQNFINSLVERLPLDIPIVVDGDGLFLIKSGLDKLKDHIIILTPHHGELRNLFGEQIDLKMPENERWKELQKILHKQWYLIAKGSPSITISKDEIWINSSGGPELAIAGSGDLLAGYLAGLCAYNPGNILNNCNTANFIHGRSGDLARKKEGLFGVTMERLTQYLPKAIDRYI